MLPVLLSWQQEDCFSFLFPTLPCVLSEFRGDVTHIHHSETPFQKLITAQPLLYQNTAHHQDKVPQSASLSSCSDAG